MDREGALVRTNPAAARGPLERACCLHVAVGQVLPLMRLHVGRMSAISGAHHDEMMEDYMGNVRELARGLIALRSYDDALSASEEMLQVW